MAALRDSYCGCVMAQTSDNLARCHGITREMQDEYALRSHRLGNQATQNGRFAEEIVPIEVKQGKKSTVVSQDDHLFPNTSLEGLSKLSPAFGPESFVTAGNASGIVDGAAAVIVTSVDAAKQAGKTPLGVIRAYASVGVPPEIMGIGPAPAIQKACERAGIRVADLDLFEINEAFAGPVPGGREDARPRSREGERQRRRDRARPPARRHRHPACSTRCCSSWRSAASAGAWRPRASAAARASR